MIVRLQRDFIHSSFEPVYLFSLKTISRDDQTDKLTVRLSNAPSKIVVYLFTVRNLLIFKQLEISTSAHFK